MKQWDKIFQKQGKVFYEPQEDMPELAKLFKKKGFKNVLDLGCGSGRHTIYFAKKGFKVYGFDIAPAGLNIAKNWLRQEGLKANIKLGSFFKKLPYKNDFFDAVVAVQAISHGRIEEIRKLIKEVRRVLKPNGLIFVAFTQRSGIKDWRVGLIQTEKFIGDDGVSRFEEKRKVLGPRTVVPIEGTEKGLIHYIFDKEAINREFKDFKIHWLRLDSKRCRYVFLAELKKQDKN